MFGLILLGLVRDWRQLSVNSRAKPEIILTFCLRCGILASRVATRVSGHSIPTSLSGGADRK